MFHMTEPLKNWSKNDQGDVLDQLVKPLNQIMFQNQPWKARTTQQWLQDNLPEFISTDYWPAASPDLNPLDYKL